MKPHIKRLLSVISLLLISAVSAFAMRGGGGAVRGGARTSVNGGMNRSANVNRNASVDRSMNVNQNMNVNRNANVNVNRDVDVHGAYYGGGCCYRPGATAAAVAGAAIVTAAAVGSVVSSIPPSCTAVQVNGLTYQQCGNTWYEPQFSGTNTTYVVVNAP